MITAIYLSLITASVSFTVTETKIFKPIREWVKGKNAFLGELISCGYCFGYWVSLALVAVYQPRLLESWRLLDFFLTAIMIAWLAAFQWALLCWLTNLIGK